MQDDLEKRIADLEGQGLVATRCHRSSDRVGECAANSRRHLPRTAEPRALLGGLARLGYTLRGGCRLLRIAVAAAKVIESTT